jgi:hypothetical protein
MNMAKSKSASPTARSTKLADREELQKFLSGLEEVRKEHADDPKIEQDQATLSYFAKFKRTKLKQLMGRAFVDALKSPSQKLGTAPKKAPTPKSDIKRN